MSKNGGFKMLIIILLVLGLFMAIAPQLSVKKEFRDDPEQIKKMRIGGIIITVLSIVVIVIQFLAR